MTYHESSKAVLKCSPRAATLLKFLIQKANNVTHSSFWRISKIIAECGFSRSTYHRAIRELVGLGFVAIKQRAELCGRQKSNEFIVNLPEFSENKRESSPKIKVANSVDLKGMAYKIYLFLQAKCGQKGYRVSRKEIASACKISMSAVSRHIRMLEKKGYMKRIAVSRNDRGNGYNFYQIVNHVKNKILKIFAFVSVFSSAALDTLPIVRNDTPRTISKFKLSNSKRKKNISNLKAKSNNSLISKLMHFRKMAKDKIVRLLN